MIAAVAFILAVATPLAQAGTLPAVEYYNVALDHYFVTSYAGEVAKLDAGLYPGWHRTDQYFGVIDPATPVAGASPVCRFYGLPAAGLDSHFYSASPAECNDVLQRFAGAWEEETPNAFGIWLPDPVTGQCPANTIPVYRAWNNRSDSNHRFTTDPATQQAMIARGYIAEGYGPGPLRVAMCAPPASRTAPTTEQRAAAAAATAAGNPLCIADQPFYWEIGDQYSRLAGSSVGSGAPGSSTPMTIASASKWIYGAYVMERQGGAASPADIKFLTFRSGYTNFVPPSCPIAATVDDCLNAVANGVYSPSTNNFFYYGSGHMQKHASLLGLGTLNDAALAEEVQSKIVSFGFTYSQPQLAGGVFASADAYAGFLRRLLSGGLQLAGKLGSDAVCTNLAMCAMALYTPVPSTESWHYSLGHWVEDDPVVGDGAFSSPGAFGFYPWIDAGKTYYGILAREAILPDNEGFSSVECGRRIRKAWQSGIAQ